MKKRILSFALAFLLVLSLAPAVVVWPAARAETPGADAPGTYNPGDIAVINAIIDNNGLDCTKANPADGSYVPADWVARVYWSDAAANKRVATLSITYRKLSGKLDVSGLTELRYLHCYSNQLTALDVSKNTELISLYCENNQLTALDVSGCTALTNVYCYNNQLTALDISSTALRQLRCENNQLAALDVSKSTVLTTLYCENNQLTALDVSNTALTQFRCHNNAMGQDPDISVPGWRSRWSVAGQSGSSNFWYYPQNDGGGPIVDDGIPFAGVTWKDSYFSQDPTVYEENMHQLATIAARLSCDAYYADYLVQNIDVSLGQLGFTGIESAHYPSDSRDTVGYTFAHKPITLAGKTYNLVAVVVRGTVADEWYGNFDIEKSDFHTGFKRAETELYNALKVYMSENGFNNGADNKFFITGHSRGAAVANLLAARLDLGEEYCPRGNLFAFTFATPNVVNKKNGDTDNARYRNIHNFVNAEDFVPYVPLSLSGWDFWKYGVTHALSDGGASNYDSFRTAFDKNYNALTGKNYVGFGYHDVTNLVRQIHALAPTVNAFSTQNYETFIGFVTPQQYFNALCDVLSGSSVVSGLAYLLGASSGVGIYSYADITDFFVRNGTALNPRVMEAHDPRTYLSRMRSTTYNNLKTNFTVNYIRVACPVDVEVYDSRGALVGRVVNNVVDESIESEISIFVDAFDDTKHIYTPDTGDYTLKMTGTDDGTMEYTVYSVDVASAQAEQQKAFSNVTLSPGKQMSSTVTADAPGTQLLLVSGDKVIGRISEDGTEKLSPTAPTGEGIEVVVDVTVIPTVQVIVLIFYNGAVLYEKTFSQ